MEWYTYLGGLFFLIWAGNYLQRYIDNLQDQIDTLDTRVNELETYIHPPFKDEYPDDDDMYADECLRRYNEEIQND